MTPPQPPAQIGIQVTGVDANSQAGIAATKLQQALTALESIRVWSEAYTAAELEALGLPAGTGDEYKSAMGEVPAVLAAFEATQFLKRMAGTGLWPAAA